MIGVYLAAYKAYLPNWNLVYNDIFKCSKHITLVCDMLTVDLSDFDFILASPPCNYYSKCNYRRDSSTYALSTKHLLPGIIEKCSLSGKPFIIENVRNSRIFKLEGIYSLADKFNLNIYEYGRHTYFTNCWLDFHNIKQDYDFQRRKLNNGRYSCFRLKSNCQGGDNVNRIFDYFCEVLHYGIKKENV